MRYLMTIQAVVIADSQAKAENKAIKLAQDARGRIYLNTLADRGIETDSFQAVRVEKVLEQ